MKDYTNLLGTKPSLTPLYFLDCAVKITALQQVRASAETPFQCRGTAGLERYSTHLQGTARLSYGTCLLPFLASLVYLVISSWENSQRLFLRQRAVLLLCWD